MNARGAKTTAQLSAELGKIGRLILPTGIIKIIKGERRVDVDDLMALAIALSVGPLTLLLPDEVTSRQEVTGASAHGGTLWEWGMGRRPLHAPMDDGSAMADYQLHAIPSGYRRLQQLVDTKEDEGD